MNRLVNLENILKTELGCCASTPYFRPKLHIGPFCDAIISRKRKKNTKITSLGDFESPAGSEPGFRLVLYRHIVGFPKKLSQKYCFISTIDIIICQNIFTLCTSINLYVVIKILSVNS